MTMTLNLDIPNLSAIDSDVLRQKLVVYAMQLIAKNDAVNPLDIQKHKCKISDEEMDELFAGRPDFDEERLTESSKEDFLLMAKSHAHKPMKGIEKWL